jgi:hypothetical protein
MRGIRHAGSNASKSAAPTSMSKGSEVRYRMSSMSRINPLPPVYFTLTRTGIAGTEQFAQPAPTPSPFFKQLYTSDCPGCRFIRSPRGISFCCAPRSGIFAVISPEKGCRFTPHTKAGDRALWTHVYTGYGSPWASTDGDTQAAESSGGRSRYE